MKRKAEPEASQYTEKQCRVGLNVPLLTPQHTKAPVGHKPFSLLPNELILLCTSHLGIASAYSLSQTSSTFNSLLNGHSRGVEKRHLLRDAVQTGSIDLVRWLLRRFGCGSGRPPLTAAATGGHLEIAKLFPMTMVLDSWFEMLLCALKEDQINVVKWLQEVKPIKKGYYFDSAISAAARAGSLQSLEWFEAFADFEASLPLTVLSAAQAGRLAVVQKYSKRDGAFCVSEKPLAQRAASSGNLELVKWLHQNGCSFKGVFSLATEIKIVIGRWLHEHGYGVGEISFFDVEGDLDALKWLREHGSEWDEDSAEQLAKCGNLSLLQWAHENGCEFNNSSIYYQPARAGNLPVIAWLHEIGCPLDGQVFSCAIHSQNLELLTWRLDNGCPGVKSLSLDAVHAGLATFRWVHENGISILSRSIISAMSMGKEDILRYAQEQGINVMIGFDNYVTFSGVTSILDFYKEIGGIFTPEHWSEAAKQKRFSCLRWAKKNNYEMTEETLKTLEDYESSIFYG